MSPEGSSGSHARDRSRSPRGRAAASRARGIGGGRAGSPHRDRCGDAIGAPATRAVSAGCQSWPVAVASDYRGSGRSGVTRYFDASALAKRYVRETGSPTVRRLLASGSAATSRLSDVEVSSAIVRRAREGAFTIDERDRMLAALQHDVPALAMVELTPEITAGARTLLLRYPLRAGDAVQLASGLYLQRQEASTGVRHLSGPPNRGSNPCLPAKLSQAIRPAPASSDSRESRRQNRDVHTRSMALSAGRARSTNTRV